MERKQIDLTGEIARAWESGELQRDWDAYIKQWDDIIERCVLMIERTCAPSERRALVAGSGMPLTVVLAEVGVRLGARWQQTIGMSGRESEEMQRLAEDNRKKLRQR